MEEVEKCLKKINELKDLNDDFSKFLSKSCDIDFDLGYYSPEIRSAIRTQLNKLRVTLAELRQE